MRHIIVSSFKFPNPEFRGLPLMSAFERGTSSQQRILDRLSGNDQDKM